MKKLSRRAVLKTGAAALAAGLSFPLNLLAGEADAPALPEASWNNLPVWHGFNLLEMFMNPWQNKDFVEDDFRIMHDWGFNFVRLPMDYRNWIVDKDWRKIDEPALKRIDKALEYGRKYGIHVLINMHRAPGYTVASPKEEKSVWTDDEALDVCALHWSTFAKRYAGVPSSQLSFNLFNEPSNIEIKPFMKVHRRLVSAIREIDPQRLIICDGMSWGTRPVMELTELKVAQATRGYKPMTVSHYKASWVANSENWSAPRWPGLNAYGTLYSPNKNGIDDKAKQPLTIDGDFPKPTTLRLKVGQVSASANIEVKADGKTILKRSFVPGPGEGEWTTVVHRPEWGGCYQNYYDLDVLADIPAGTKKVTVHMTGGDWIFFKELGLKVEGEAEESIPTEMGWNIQPGQLLWQRTDNGRYEFGNGGISGQQWLYQETILPWEALRPFGKCVMVGEFGAYNKTPHDAVLRWMEDMLANWKEQGWGWAMWNLRGTFGILDSNRADVQYETVAGHQLDRKALKLLQKYLD